MSPRAIIHDPRRKLWLAFRTPRQIVAVSQPGEVLDALRAIETAVERDRLHAAGFIAYEAAPAFDPALQVHAGTPFPLLWFGLYDTVTETPLLPAEGQHPAAPRQPLDPLPWQPSMSREAYEAALAQVRQCLFQGETYQVNYTFRLAAPCRHSPWSLFQHLVAAQGPHYAAFIETGAFAIASASPELFFRLDGDHLVSRPMKGTTHRGRTLVEDLAQSGSLLRSEKNRAENVMIVDMIRNDLGRVATPGSVIPDPLFELERYPTVWQMTSTVAARTRAPLVDILRALFPCASVTGAPKPKTMEIIARLETTPRRVYTGAIGYIRPGRRAQFNVAIRTVLVDKAAGQAEYGVGGGIVWDSDPRDEYEECWQKARILTESPPEFRLLETLLWTPDESFRHLERHLGRMQDSASYFGYPLPLDTARHRLEQAASAWRVQGAPAMRVRLLLDRDGTIAAEGTPFELQPAGQPVRLGLAATPVDPDDRFLYHKTTHRAVYENARAARPGVDDVLLWNTRGELTESTIANVVVELDGQRLTPPVSCGLLPGTFRAELLDQGAIKEGVIRLEDLDRCQGLHLISSLRLWRRAALVRPPHQAP